MVLTTFKRVLGGPAEGKEPAMMHNQGWFVHHCRQSYPHHDKVINGKPGVINDFTLTIGPPSPSGREAGGED
jgi:hypothetical protein